MLKIKLSRIGKKKHPIYRLIVLEEGRDPYGKSLEILGSWDPHTKNLQVKADRVKHWIGHGAQMTDTVNNLFVDKKIVEGKKVNVSALGKKAKDALKKSKEAIAIPATAPAADLSSEALAKEEELAAKEPKVEEAVATTEAPVEVALEASIEITPEAPVEPATADVENSGESKEEVKQ